MSNEKGLIVSGAVIVFCVVALIFACGMLASGQLVLMVDELADSQGQVMNSLIVGFAALSWVSLPWLLAVWMWKRSK